MSDVSIKTPSKSTNILIPILKFVSTTKRLAFKGGFLKQEKISFSHGKIVNIYMVYGINENHNTSSYLILDIFWSRYEFISTYWK